MFSEDVAQMILIALENQLTGVFHVAFDRACTLAEYLQLVANCLNNKNNKQLDFETVEEEQITCLPSVTTRTGILSIEKASKQFF